MARRARAFTGKSWNTYARVVGEPFIEINHIPRSRIKGFANANARAKTRAEEKFWYIINGLLRGTSERVLNQHIVSGKWIVDFYVPTIRLAIEIDGSFHNSSEQQAKDRLKENDCLKLDITLIRITNAEVFGDRELLKSKLRSGWREAKARKNNFVGKLLD